MRAFVRATDPPLAPRDQRTRARRVSVKRTISVRPRSFVLAPAAAARGSRRRAPAAAARLDLERRRLEQLRVVDRRRVGDELLGRLVGPERDRAREGRVGVARRHACRRCSGRASRRWSPASRRSAPVNAIFAAGPRPGPLGRQRSCSVDRAVRRRCAPRARVAGLRRARRTARPPPRPSSVPGTAAMSTKRSVGANARAGERQLLPARRRRAARPAAAARPTPPAGRGRARTPRRRRRPTAASPSPSSASSSLPSVGTPSAAAAGTGRSTNAPPLDPVDQPRPRLGLGQVGRRRCGRPGRAPDHDALEDRAAACASRSVTPRPCGA